MKRILISLVTLLLTAVYSWGDDFTLGADISWCTEMEARGQKVYNYLGEEREATALMKEMGMDAVRLRVWVDPSEHGNYCNADDVLAKALRAKALGMDVMIDFHYSDWWADPAKQNIPKAWEKHKYKQLCADVAEHTKSVLTLLKDNGVTPKWVQVGNETSNGFLWPVGKIRETDGELKGMWMGEDQMKQYAGLFKAGYEATKAVFPDALVIVHLDKGYDSELYMTNLDALKNNGAKWDLIGMSLYPYWAFDSGYTGTIDRLYSECMTNIKDLYARYGTESMITETGFLVDETDLQTTGQGREDFQRLITLCKTATDGHCKGVFYWEPTCKPSKYKLGAFHEDGTPTDIMRAVTTEKLFDEGGPAPEKYDRKIMDIVTNMGTISIELYNETPKHRDAYISSAKAGTLNGTQFHRVIKNFMIQGGKTGDGATIDAEIMYPRFWHKRGAVAAAREGDEKNPTYKSRANQFYIVWDNASHLDKTYTVFGEVVGGMDVFDKIRQVPVDHAQGDKPINEVRIISCEVRN
jgi:arabinogalactan endo-1,4-beta-galactosidase